MQCEDRFLCIQASEEHSKEIAELRHALTVKEAYAEDLAKVSHSAIVILFCPVTERSVPFPGV